MDRGVKKTPGNQCNESLFLLNQAIPALSMTILTQVHLEVTENSGIHVCHHPLYHVRYLAQPELSTEKQSAQPLPASNQV
jgi:hypothetical protein